MAWARIGTVQVAGGQNTEMWWAGDVVSGTATVNWGGGIGAAAVIIAEYNNAGSVVQSAQGTSTAASGGTIGFLAYPSNVTAGNLLYAGFNYDPTAAVPIGTLSGGSGGVAVWSLDAFNTAHTAFSSTGTSSGNVSATITAAASGELLVSLFTDPNGAVPVFTAGTGWTLTADNPGANTFTGAAAVEAKIGTGTSGQTATWTTSVPGDNCVIQIAAFPLPASSAGWTNTDPPSVTGVLTAGSTLTCNVGTWSPTPGGYNYQWQKADDAVGTNDFQISGGTGSTITIGTSDSGKYFRCFVQPHT